ncbi:MAG: acetyl-CoA carboxylase biotin carboxyl carrier protein subunit [Lentisphaeraceae bacterium]|nr:acetyl-CoA carboxylase biotin carboxyl carrier protein subunit [Lentisphaeraceae bacterium]
MQNGVIYKVNRAQLSSEKFSGERRICAPLPARVIALFKKVGDEVKAGEDVICLEAMKMEHRLCAEISGFIKSINTSCGQQLKAGDLLVEISSENS